MAPTVKLFFHDACFDGTASAAIFAAFYREVVSPGANIVPVGMIHRDGNPFEQVVFDGDDHACVDFRFCADERMRWWFDHHRTAFQPSVLREKFDADTTGTKFFDATAPSCAGMMATVLPAAFGWQLPEHLQNLPEAADIIDSARYSSADEAVAVTTPAQQLALWISRNSDPAEAARYIDTLSREGMEATAGAPWLADEVAELAAAREASRGMLRGLAMKVGAVVVFDLLDLPGATANAHPGFLGYQLFPDARYIITLLRGPLAIKISVGVNPWSGVPRSHDIGDLCEALGGGGHSAVGGITLELTEVARARAAAASLVASLNS